MSIAMYVSCLVFSKMMELIIKLTRRVLYKPFAPHVLHFHAMPPYQLYVNTTLFVFHNISHSFKLLFPLITFFFCQLTSIWNFFFLKMESDVKSFQKGAKKSDFSCDLKEKYALGNTGSMKEIAHLSFTISNRFYL